MPEIPSINFDIQTTPQSVGLSIDPADVITVPIDDTLSISGMAADAKATGDAIRAKLDAPRAWPLTIAPADWTGGGPYTYTVTDSNVTADFALACIWRDGSAEHLRADLAWVTGAGSITLTTASLPVGTLAVTLIGLEV